MLLREVEYAKPGSVAEALELLAANDGARALHIDTIDGADFGGVELHQMKMEGGMMQMRPLKGLDIPAHKLVVLAEGDKHLMLMNPRHPFKEGDSAVLHMYQGRVVAAELPAAVELTVAETEPGVQGDRVSGARKQARLETGLVVQVPLFVESGERIKVDTRTGEYLARA